MARNPAFDITFYCDGRNSAGVPDQGILVFDVELSVGSIHFSPSGSALDFNIILEGRYVTASVFQGTFPDLGIELSADWSFEPVKANWVKWSNIGEIDFAIGRKNVAGEMPIGWSGTVWAIGKLGKDVIVYGSGGVTRLVTDENIFGKQDLLKLGLKNSRAVAVTDQVHVFIDSTGCLWKLTDKLERVGYEEYLGALTSPIISYDVTTNFAYICDGTTGYVFNVLEPSLGTCQPNITGIGYQGGVSYIISSGTILAPTFEISTDILDFEGRGNKTIHELELGTNHSGALEAGVDFCNTMSGSFTSTPWFPVTPEGRAFIHAFGKEFKIKIRATSLVPLDLDYMRVKGIIHDYNPIDT